MIVWGGYATGGVANSGGRYCVQASAPVALGAVSRKSHGVAGGFDVDLSLSGMPGIECRTGGATNDHQVVVTFAGNVAVNGNPQAAVTSGVGTIGSAGVSNGGAVTVNGNTVSVPLTNVANAQALSVTLNAVNGGVNITVPLRLLLGDTNGDGAVNSGDALQKRALGRGQSTRCREFPLGRQPGWRCEHRRCGNCPQPVGPVDPLARANAVVPATFRSWSSSHFLRQSPPP